MTPPRGDPGVVSGPVSRALPSALAALRPLYRSEVTLSRRARIKVSRVFSDFRHEPEPLRCTPFYPLSLERDPRRVVRAESRALGAREESGRFSCEERATYRCCRGTAPALLSVRGGCGGRFDRNSQGREIQTLSGQPTPDGGETTRLQEGNPSRNPLAL